jgi:multidrug resistance efflux pump
MPGLSSLASFRRSKAETNQAAVRVAAANMVSAQSGVLLAKAQLQSAEAAQTVSEATLANYTRYAPYDAWVVSRNLDLGGAVNPGQSVFTLVAPKGI